MLTNNDLKQIANLLKPIKEDTEVLKKGQISIKKQLTRIKKDIKFISGDYDERIVANTRDIEKLKQAN